MNDNNDNNKTSPQVGATILGKSLTADRSNFIKAENNTSISTDENAQFNLRLVAKPYPSDLLESLKRESDILPQCINAYKNNIVGFGIGIKYKDDSLEVTPTMEAERLTAERLIDNLSMEKSTKKMFEDIIDFRETFGYCYVEVLRNSLETVVQLTPLEAQGDVWPMQKDSVFTDYAIIRNGEIVESRKRFRKYVQMTGGRKVYFKELNDPRIMDYRTGEYNIDTDINYQANELWHIKIGAGTIGTPRWEGVMLDNAGGRSARALNYRYLKNGRHTPMAVIIKGGQLTPDSKTVLTEYMNGITSEQSQHKWLMLEVEKLENASPLDEASPVDVELKSLADVLQKDELFQEFINNNREKTQSTFLLPDIYVAYTQDFNVATAREATKKTEEQVFQPERQELAWLLNNQILNDHMFEFVEVYFKSPSMDNSDILVQLLNVAVRGGGITPNQIGSIIANSINVEFVDFEEDWGNVPLEIYKLTNQVIPNLGDITKSMQTERTVDVLKDLRKALKEVSKNV